VVFVYFIGFRAVGIPDVIPAATVVGGDAQHPSGHHFCPHNLLTVILAYLVTTV
jgi:hypothetical protein